MKAWNVSLLLFCFWLTGLTACSPRPQYDWGTYNDSIHGLYVSPENYILDEDIERLASEMEKTEPGKVPPGKAAHLGFLYTTKGLKEEARRYFELEKSLFPESTVLMNRLIHQSAKK